MTLSLRLAWVALALAALPVTAASACSVVDDYRVPTNLELAQGAELIMLGRVTGVEGGNDEDNFMDRAIVIEPLSAIKGALPPAAIKVGGMALTEGELARYGALSNPYELEASHPASYIGGCIRYMFPRGTTALFFLAHGENGEWRPSGDAFSRWAEDVLSDDAPWLRLTRLYVQATAAPEDERPGLLEAERARLAALPDDPVAALMAHDIERQLAGPNKPWNALMSEMMGPMGSEQEVAAASAADTVRSVEAEADVPETKPRPNRR